MHRVFIFLFSISVSLSAFAQNHFAEGYFTDNQGNTTECLVSNKSWLRNPGVFNYKLGSQGEIQNGSVSSVREFGVGDTRYVRFEVDVDTSTNKMDSLKANFAPEWKRDTIFLSVLVDGKADLLFYNRRGEDKYFFRTDDKPVTQLVHKLYRTIDPATQVTRIATNNFYKNQLKNEVNCRGFSDERLNGLHYDISVLTKFFRQQNECWGSEVSAIDEMKRRTLRIKLTPGISFADADAYVGGKLYEDYKPNVGLRAGAEFEFSLPFHRRKWAVFAEPTWQSFKSTGRKRASETVSYTSLEFALGLRHYFLLGKNGNIFINGSGVLDLPIEYVSSYSGSIYRLDTSSISAAAGVGGTFKRFSLEARYYTDRTTDRKAGLPISDEYKKISVIVGYRIF